ncbi:hypothetical protein QL919_03915 [Psychrobacter sp. APC 3426]|jgi:hypothetical protein|uniref:hypothetical protein n=1 Tax=Psychrobacter TaxID=497 RepID=UPI0025B4A377|nr:hypothetical protein [Psychrobacter sp. APC 3426]MDN3397870.1 hypothetical protein [Psychrobacter sp. APC 3426]
MGDPRGDDYMEGYYELTPEEQQLEDDITEQMAKQGLTHDDFEGEVPFGAFVDLKR